MELVIILLALLIGVPGILYGIMSIFIHNQDVALAVSLIISVIIWFRVILAAERSDNKSETSSTSPQTGSSSVSKKTVPVQSAQAERTEKKLVSENKEEVTKKMEPKKKICQHCGAEVKPGDIYCVECGYEV